MSSIELVGERPSTEIVFRYTDTRKPAAHAVRVALWRSEYPTDGASETLQEPVSVAGWIYSDWLARDLDPIDTPSD